MKFNLVEAEGLQEFWDEIEEPEREEPKSNDMNYTKFEMSIALEQDRPDEFYCWQGSRIPLWFE
jgi:hypothetical protein